MTLDPLSPNPAAAHRARPFIAVFLLCAALAAIALPLIFTDHPGTRPQIDETRFHLPTVREFAREWPHFDFSDYLSATTPGYHLSLAVVDRFMTDKLVCLRLAGLLFALGLVATLGAAVARRAGAAGAILLCLPFVCSMYVISAAAWLAPDDVGWWGVLCVLLIALRSRVDFWTFGLACVGFLALLLVRQSHIWIAGPLVVAAWYGSETPRAAESDKERSFARALTMFFCLVPGVTALAWFVRLWRGLLPPNQKLIVGGVNPSAPAFALAVTGAIGIFFVPLILHRLASLAVLLRVAVAGAFLGFLVSALPPTTFSYHAGRYSGLWNATPRALVFHDRSAVIIGLATLGGAIISTWLSLLPRRERIIWGTTIVAFGVAQVGTIKAFQRYDEPLILIAAALGSAGLVRGAPRAAWAGPVILCGFLLALTYRSMSVAPHLNAQTSQANAFTGGGPVDPAGRIAISNLPLSREGQNSQPQERG